MVAVPSGRYLGTCGLQKRIRIPADAGPTLYDAYRRRFPRPGPTVFKGKGINVARNLSEDEDRFLNWYAALAEDPEYYTNTEQGQKELAEMIRGESERLIEELGKSVKRTREIIWLSHHCKDCAFFHQDGSRMQCGRWQVRIVKPFYGRPIWGKTPSKMVKGETELVVEGVDWNQKWKEISDQIVEKAVGMVNGGYPYHCFTSK